MHAEAVDQQVAKLDEAVKERTVPSLDRLLVGSDDRLHGFDGRPIHAPVCAIGDTSSMPEDALQDRPVELLQRLLRFDTSNPPGNERECIEWVRGLLEALGCEVRIVAQEPERPNLIARIGGRGESPPLLLQGHVDVVAARGEWRHGPFDGELDDGHVWGRGALDMKGGVAMMLAAFMRAKASGAQPPGDVILCLLADEEAGSALGAELLVREHPELFDGVRYSIG